jgi:hypothetical protein
MKSLDNKNAGMVFENGKKSFPSIVYTYEKAVEMVEYLKKADPKRHKHVYVQAGTWINRKFTPTEVN